MVVVALLLSIASMLLHLIAPRTATTVDDEVVEVIDEVKDKLSKP